MKWVVGLLLAAQPIPLLPMRGPATPDNTQETGPEQPGTDEDRIARAAEAFAQGEAAFAQEDFEAAVEAFERAQRLAPHPYTQFNLGTALERAGQLEAAWDTFTSLRASPESEEFREDVDQHIDALRKQVAFLSIESSPNSTVCLDGRRVDGQRTLLKPGPHHVETAHVRHELELLAGDDVRLDLRYQTPPPRVTPRPVRSLAPWLGVAIGASVGAVALGLGASTQDGNARRGMAGVSAGLSAVSVGASIGALVIHRQDRDVSPMPDASPHDEPPC